MLAYKGFTEAQAKAHKRYMEGVATIQLRTTDEQREAIKDRAAALGLSVNAYVLGLVEADFAGLTPPTGESGGAVGGGVTSPNIFGSQKDS